ncbi:hypothetical protein JW948_11135 [bacterium]|nr:hypothetical protein [bacterium]
MRLILTLMICVPLCFAQKMIVEDLDANMLMEVNDEGSVGSITLPQGSAPPETADKLYNVDGVLNWNGSALIPSQTGNSGKVLSTDGTGTVWKTHNVPKAATVGGNQDLKITKNYAWYQNIRSVTITTPGPGMVIAIASGTIDWESKGWDLLLASILSNSDPNESWDAENEFYRYLTIVTDYNCPDSSDQFASFTCHRGFNVGAGTQTFTLWANKYSSAALVSVLDVNLSVMYFPTGTAVFSDSQQILSEDPQIYRENSVAFPPPRAR